MERAGDIPIFKQANLSLLYAREWMWFRVIASPGNAHLYNEDFMYPRLYNKDAI